MSKSVEKPHRAKPESSASGSIRPTNWTAREAQRHKIEQIKAKERMMKEAKESTERIKREARLDRKRKLEEKARLEMMGKKVCGDIIFHQDDFILTTSYFTPDERKEAGPQEEATWTNQEGVALTMLHHTISLYHSKPYPFYNRFKSLK
jgi:hypothetical protein